MLYSAETIKGTDYSAVDPVVSDMKSILQLSYVLVLFALCKVLHCIQEDIWHKTSKAVNTAFSVPLHAVLMPCGKRQYLQASLALYYHNSGHVCCASLQKC